jgi:hypothetical protein
MTLPDNLKAEYISRAIPQASSLGWVCVRAVWLSFLVMTILQLLLIAVNLYIIPLVLHDFIAYLDNDVSTSLIKNGFALVAALCVSQLLASLKNS